MEYTDFVVLVYKFRKAKVTLKVVPATFGPITIFKEQSLSSHVDSKIDSIYYTDPIYYI